MTAGHADRPPIAGRKNGGRGSELERLALLHDRGALTDAEFAAEKATSRAHYGAAGRVKEAAPVLLNLKALRIH